MKYMLDTNILIYLIKNKPPEVAERVDALNESDALCMSFVTFAELLKGAERSTRKQESLRKLEQLSREVPVQYETNRALSEHYAIWFTALKAAGTPIGGNDLWIACHALAENATLVTNNTREFERIAGLRIENWAEPVAKSAAAD
ncbi:ribonuclease VapC [Parazoarcus communis]|uniref:Ribonuclease VapC n=2 Tax=Parazoarcus communis TaxID=41977 RepID=A0A2U8H2B2_9RHOO|nr:ribonuclease VapC [Parazoarcus communis]